MAEGQGRSSGQGVKLLYIRDYLHKHTNKAHPKNAKEISAYLASKGIKADRKTIYNDILRLQVDFQEPIEYNPRKKGYYIAEPTFSLSELQALLDSVQSAEFLSASEVSSLSQKIVGLTNIHDQKELAANKDTSNTFARPVDSTIEKVSIIKQAIRENKKISFRKYIYYPTDGNRANHGKQLVTSGLVNDVHIRSPHTVFCHRGKYWLSCYLSECRVDQVNDFMFNLDNIEDITILSIERDCDDSIQPDYNAMLFKDYDAIAQYHASDEFWDDIIKDESSVESMVKFDWVRDVIIDSIEEEMDFVFLAQMEYLTTLAFKKENASSILEKFGQDIVLVPTPGEYCYVTLRITMDMEFFEWLFSMRRQVVIIDPPEVRNLYLTYVNNIALIYSYWDMCEQDLLMTLFKLLIEKISDKNLAVQIAQKVALVAQEKEKAQKVDES